MATCCTHCGVEEGELHLSNCPELRSAFERIERQRDEALAEVERLKAEYNETLQMAATQAVTIKNQIGEIERLRQCCTQRGARMQIIWDWMGLVAVRNFLLERPEARDWFDEDGVPK